MGENLCHNEYSDHKGVNFLCLLQKNAPTALSCVESVSDSQLSQEQH